MKKISKPFSKEYMNPPEIQIISGDYVNLNDRWHSDGVVSPFARLYFIDDGEGLLRDEKREWRMRPNQVYLIPTGTRFDYRCDDKLAKFFLHFNMIGEDGRDLMRSLSGISRITVSQDEISQIVKLYKKDSLTSSVMLRGTILNVLGRLMKLYPKDALKRPTYSPSVKQAMDRIRDNLSLQLTSADIAKDLFIAESTLRKRFKDEVGMTINRYISDLVFFKAELLLVKSDYNMREISDSLGFCDQFYFSRRFAEYYGMPPQKYRTMMRDKEAYMP